MAMRKQAAEQQADTWILTTSLARSPGHPFDQRLNQILRESSFDAFVEKRAASFYAERNGRPSIPPGVYMRMLLIGFFKLPRVGTPRGLRGRLAALVALCRRWIALLVELRPASLHRSEDRIDFVAPARSLGLTSRRLAFSTGC